MNESLKLAKENYKMSHDLVSNKLRNKVAGPSSKTGFKQRPDLKQEPLVQCHISITPCFQEVWKCDIGLKWNKIETVHSHDLKMLINQ